MHGKASRLRQQVFCQGESELARHSTDHALPRPVSTDHRAPYPATPLLFQNSSGVTFACGML